MKKSKLNTRVISKYKVRNEITKLQLLTCYDYQTAQMLDQTDLDMILVGDSLGNVVLGYETTVSVTLEEMIIFSKAVRRGAKNTFVIADLPFGSYRTFETGIENSTNLFQQTNVEALKLEGASPYKLEIISRLTEIGIPIMGHIGLTPQSVHQLGGYYIHGRSENESKILLQEAQALEKAGAFSIVLECIKEDVAKTITQEIGIPTIGIGSGPHVDGDILVINDLFHMGQEKPPKFCTPLTNHYQQKKDIISNYLKAKNEGLYNH